MNLDSYLKYNEWLFNKWSHLKDRENLAYPYLTFPSQAFLKSKVKILFVNKETNGWGEKEKFQIDDNLKCNLINLYDSKININWDNLGSVWPMFYALRCLSEGDNPEISDFYNNVGVLQTNVALIGKKYGDTGYDTNILDLLIKACDKFFKLVNANIIILSIGFGTKTHMEAPYLKILEQTEFFGKLKRIELCDNSNTLFKLNFENTGQIEVYGCPHPQGLSYRPIVGELSKIIEKKLKSIQS